MPAQEDVELCVIGAGSAALLGAKTILIERDRVGGECLNTGCVPSKALLAAAKAAHAVRNAKKFGVDAESSVDFRCVHAHVRDVIKTIEPHDSAPRFESMGVKVVRGEARFTGPRTITVDGRQIRARRVVIATASEPAIPPIPSLQEVPFFTNETVFENDSLPSHLIILGGGPIGIEIGQAYRRLGASVTIIERDQAMPKDDPELAQYLLKILSTEGVLIREKTEVKAVARDQEGVCVTVEEAGQLTQLPWFARSRCHRAQAEDCRAQPAEGGRRVRR